MTRPSRNQGLTSIILKARVRCRLSGGRLKGWVGLKQESSLQRKPTAVSHSSAPLVSLVSSRCLSGVSSLLGGCLVSPRCLVTRWLEAKVIFGGSYPTAPSCLTSCLDCPTSWLELMTQNISLQALATTLLLSCFKRLRRWLKLESSLLRKGWTKKNISHCTGWQNTKRWTFWW